MQEILSVTELTREIKKQLESRFPFVSVKGEITNFKEQSSGHLYFTLKDAESQLSAVLFRGNARELSRLPKNGDQVVVKGEVQVYAPRGSYQIIIRNLEFAGVGALLMQLHQRKAKLQALGWFEPSRKKSLPRYPKRIGVITSPTGAVIQDILQVLGRRNPGLHLLLNPVKVQGEGAAEEIAKAIGDFNRYQLADLLIVGRGGGSLEDLWAFNEEIVASAIFHSNIPIISAVGHETDFSISDFVADVRAPTPSAAAEIASNDAAQQIQYLKSSKYRLTSTVATLIHHHRKQLSLLIRQPILATTEGVLGTHFQKVDDLQSDLSLAWKRAIQEKINYLTTIQKQIAVLKPSNRIAVFKQQLLTLKRSFESLLIQQQRARNALFHPIAMRKRLDDAMRRKVVRAKEQLTPLVSHLKGIDPKNLLSKGYCILFQEKTDSVILSTRMLNLQDRVRLQMSDGRVDLTVNGKYDD